VSCRFARVGWAMSVELGWDGGPGNDFSFFMQPYKRDHTKLYK
jgi:hypothetical protein